MHDLAKIYTLLRLLLMVLKVLPIIGPRIMRAAITTIATNTRIKAYSTNPWPFSFGANNMGILLSLGLGPILLEEPMTRRLEPPDISGIRHKIRHLTNMQAVFVVKKCFMAFPRTSVLASAPGAAELAT
jgi:hypothetical protein